MNTKLTLRLDDKIISRAKKYAAREGKSLSQIVSGYFKTIENEDTKNRVLKLKPNTRRLHGSLKGAKISKNDYKDHLESKYL